MEEDLKPMWALDFSFYFAGTREEAEQRAEQLADELAQHTGMDLSPPTVRAVES